MGNHSTAVTSGNRRWRRAIHRSARAYLTAAGALAGTGILAVSLVVVTPDADTAGRQAGAVQLAAFALPPGAPQGAVLAKLVNSQAGMAASVVLPLSGKRSDISNANVVRQLPLGSATERAELNTAALAPAATGVDLGAILASIVGPILLFGPIILLVVLACAPCAIFNVVTGLIRSILIDLTPVPEVAQAAKTATGLALTGEAVAGESTAAAPPDPIAFLTEQAEILGAGIQKSAGLALPAAVGTAVALPASLLFLSLAGPTAIPTILALGASANDSIWTGVRDISLVAPGYYVPIDIAPTSTGAHAVALQKALDGSVLPATVAAINNVASNLTAAGVPRVVEQALVSSERVGVTLFQAQSLVRTAGFGAAQDLIDGVAAGDVGAGVQAGATRIQRAVFGDADAPAAHVDPLDPLSETDRSVGQLGAIGAIATGVGRAVSDVSEALTTSASSQRGTNLALVGNERTALQSARDDNGPAADTAKIARKTPMRDAINKAGSDLRKNVKQAVTKVSHSLKKTLSGGGRTHAADGG